MRFKVNGTKVYIGFPFAAASTLMLLFDRTNVAMFSLISALLHESGHLIAMILLNERPMELSLSVFGMRIRKYAESDDYRKEIAIAAAGPLANILLAVIMIILAINSESNELLMFSSVNLSLGIFNALPIAESDGAHILECILKRHFEDENAEKIVFIVSVIFIIPIFFCGFYLLIKSKYNFSLLVVSIYLMLLVLLKKKKN